MSDNLNFQFDGMTDDQVGQLWNRVANRLAKWRTVFAGWQLGTRSKEDPVCQAVRDHREVTIMLRAEVNALVKCLVDAGVMTERKFTEELILEADRLSKDYERKFPGISTNDEGIVFQAPEAAETMKHWPP